MTGQEFFDSYEQRLNDAETSIELRNIRNELLDLSMKFCENEQFNSEYRIYISQLLSLFNNKIVDAVTNEVRSKHRK